MSGPESPWDADPWSSAEDDEDWRSDLAEEAVPDITALLPPNWPDEYTSWIPSPESVEIPILQDLYEWQLDLLARFGIPLAATTYALLCAKGMKKSDWQEVSRAMESYLEGDDKVVLTDPCQILRLARIGVCVARRYLRISFGPDLFDFWLDGKAADPANLSRETLQMPPDDRGIPTTVSFYPMDTSWFFGRVGTKVENALVFVQEPSLWQGVLDRLRAPADTVFPEERALSAEDVSPLRAQVPVGPGPSTLHTAGFDWIYPAEMAVVFKHEGQTVGDPVREIVDPELFLLGGMTVTSEVEVQAVAGELSVGGETVDGWTVTVLSWRVRVSDRIDFHGKETGDKSQGIPLGPVDLELPDQLFVDLQSQGCPGTPTPVDFDVVSDAWHEVPPGLLSRPSLFVSLETVQVGEENPFGGAPEAFDFFDPATGEGVSLHDA